MSSDSDREQASPGTLLRRAREARNLSARETADRLNWMPSYVGIIERDDYKDLRRPAFARGYVKAYGRLMGLDESALLAAFDTCYGDTGERGEQQRDRRPASVAPERVPRLAIGLCLLVLALLVLGLWWWQSGAQAPAEPAAQMQPENANTGEV